MDGERNRMSCDLIIQNESGRLIVVSAGAWSIVEEKDKSISVNYPYNSSATGVRSTNVKISIESFLRYKKHCEKLSLDANLTDDNIKYIVMEFSDKKK